MAGSSEQRPGPRMTTMSYRSPLAHPLWWLSLALLLVNDHLLKTSPLQGWLTGKLSDFAGMIVAPVLAAELLRARSHPRRLLAFALVVMPFAAINLSEQAAGVVVGLLACVGVSWRIWSDPADLMALIVLPLAWMLSCHRSAGTGAARSSVLPWVHRFGIVGGALGCIATSVSSEKFETAAYLVNMTHEDLVVHVYRPREPLDCDAVVPDPRAALTAEQFDFDKCRSVEPFVPLPLDTDWADVSQEPLHPNPNPGAWRECDAVVVHAHGLPDTVLFWNRVSKTTLETEALRVQADEAVDDPRAVLVEQLGQRRLLGPGPVFVAWEVDWPLPPPSSACEDAP